DRITVRDWQSATDVGYTYENRAKGGVTARAEARLLIGAKIDPDKGTSTTLDDEMLGVGGMVGASAGAAIGGKMVRTDSLNQVTRRGEVEISTTFGVSGGIYARFHNVFNMGTGAAGVHSGAQDGANQQLGTDDKGKPLYNVSENVGNYDVVNVGASITT